MGDVADLLTRAFTDPAGALDEAGARLPFACGAERVELLRVLGNACRELRRVDDAVRHLEDALDGAVAIGDRELEGRAAMSLAASLSYSGDLARSLELGERAVALLTGADRAPAMSQLAGLLRRAGRTDDALAAFTAALDAAARSDDRSIEADLRCNRGVLYGWSGEIAAAEADSRRAVELYDELGWTKGAADVRHNLAWLAGRRGDLVEAFRRFDEAERAYESLGLTGAAVFPDRSESLLAAGLTHEALVLARCAASGLRAKGDDVDLAEALMLVARAALLADDAPQAEVASVEATALFEAQGRAGWCAAAASLQVEARLRTGSADDEDVRRIEAVISATTAAGLAPAAAEARVLAAELEIGRGGWAIAGDHLDVVVRADLGLAARCRLDLARVRVSAAGGRHDEALAACADAVREFAELTAQLGGTELRAHVALHVAELVEHGLALAVRGQVPAVVFAWSERQRASALSSPPVRPPDDDEVAADLDRLRAALTELDTAKRKGTAEDELAHRCSRLQDRVRRRTRHARGEVQRATEAGTLDAIGDGDVAAWVSYVEVGGELLAVRVVEGDAAVVELGTADAVRREVAGLQAMLSMHLNALGRGIDRDPAVVLASAADADAALLGPLDLPAGPLVLSPAAGLHALPWGLLATLRERPFVLAPSVALWRRCLEVDASTLTRAVAVAGPDVALADVEAREVAASYPSGTVLAGRDASVAGVVSAIAGVDVAHLACHGRFSVENPMFSSLRLADGPMFVHDLERLVPTPRVVVLSACHAGAHATPTGREILGLTASLLARGPRAVIAATAPIPDALATVALMAQLHRSLADGVGPAQALLDARITEPVLAGAFACHGAA